MPKIIHHRDKCIGCNACVEAAPENWVISRKDGKAVLMNGQKKGKIFHTIIRPDEWENNEKAAKNCPVNIIKLIQ